MNESVNILAIESSCDETAAAIVRNGRELLGSALASSIEIQKKFGGVVPELASRAQLESILPVVESCLDEAGLTPDDIDAIGVTCGPGLVGSLLVGLTAAKTLAFAWDKKLIGVHHLAGHVAANYLVHPELQPPFLALIVSGGHTHLVHVNDYTDFRLLAKTRDDAVGEVYDKLSRELGLGYPGGPVLDKLAQKGNPERFKLPIAHFADSYDFSFSGLKTAALEILQKERQRRQREKLPEELDETWLQDFAASFQKTVVDTLVGRTLDVLENEGERDIVIAGGVSANRGLREAADRVFTKRGLKVYYPPLSYCTDNAMMIAAQAYYHYREGDFEPLSLNATSRLDLPTKA